MTLPLPQQLSTDPGVNSSAMAWAAQLVDALQRHAAFFTDVAGARKIGIGVASVHWPGGAAASDVATVATGLIVQPVVALATPQNAYAFAAAQTDTGVDGSITIRLHTTDGSSPAAGNQLVFWVAIG